VASKEIAKQSSTLLELSKVARAFLEVGECATSIGSDRSQERQQLLQHEAVLLYLLDATPSPFEHPRIRRCGPPIQRGEFAEVVKERPDSLRGTSLVLFEDAFVNEQQTLGARRPSKIQDCVPHGTRSAHRCFSPPRYGSVR
jgi:hypothetical protein